MAAKGKAKAKDEAPVERVFEGLGVSPGIAIGIVHLRESGAISVPEYRVPQSRVAAELQRFSEAVERARRQVAQLKSKARNLPDTVAEELGFLLDAYTQMLQGSRLIRGVEKRIEADRINAEAAVQAELSALAESFNAMDDAYLAARLQDIREVGGRIVRILVRKAADKPLSTIPKGSVIIAEELTPADTAQMDPSRVVGFATMLGGAEGHTAIMARSLGLPAVLGAAELLRGVRSGDQIVIDGQAGRVIVNPKPKTIEIYEHHRALRQRETKRLARLRNRRAVTRDGVEISLQANVELPIEMDNVGQMGAAGIGLLRTEFMFMNRSELPTEDEQYHLIRDMVERMEGREVTVRTLDVGGDKIAESLLDEMGTSAVSALGLRGIRLSLAKPELLELQFGAILRAANHGPVRVLLPMVTTASEVRKAREMLRQTYKRLQRQNIKVPDNLPPLGVMIEVPGAALAADALAQNADFFSIGSNDLTMYTLAIDRGDEQVAHLFDPLHPAVLRLIQFSAEAALRARIPVCICGEMAGDPRYAALLMGLGFRDLSMTAANIPRVKQRIRELDMVGATRRARVIMDQVDSGRIATLLDDFNALAAQ